MWPSEFITLRDGVYIFAGLGTDVGEELFVSDGTAAGTRVLADCWKGRQSGSPKHMVRLGSGASARVVFTAATDPVNRELWITDGTSAGTMMLAELHPTSGSFPAALTTNAASTLVFFRADDGVHGRDPGSRTEHLKARG